jgi:hypothetical protein
MELWDLHHIRRLDDAGFIDSLYGGQKAADNGHHHGKNDAVKKDVGGNVTETAAVGHTDCDDACAATH